jgi:glutathione S-transferase
MSESQSTLILYGNSMWTSPYVLSAFVALTEKKLPFRVETIALEQGVHRQTEYVRTSLTSRVPALVDGAFTLSESSAIVEYLEDKWPSPSYPAVLPHDVEARARARQVMAWVRSDLMPLREERSSEYVFYPHAGLSPFRPLSSAGRVAADKLIALAERLIPTDAGTLFGAWCIADTDLAMMLQRLLKTGEPLPARIRQFAESEWQRPSVQAFVNMSRPPYRGS